MRRRHLYMGWPSSTIVSLDEAARRPARIFPHDAREALANDLTSLGEAGGVRRAE